MPLRDSKKHENDPTRTGDDIDYSLEKKRRIKNKNKEIKESSWWSKVSGGQRKSLIDKTCNKEESLNEISSIVKRGLESSKKRIKDKKEREKKDYENSWKQKAGDKSVNEVYETGSSKKGPEDKFIRKHKIKISDPSGLATANKENTETTKKIEHKHTPDGVYESEGFLDRFVRKAKRIGGKLGQKERLQRKLQSEIDTNKGAQIVAKNATGGDNPASRRFGRRREQLEKRLNNVTKTESFIDYNHKKYMEKYGPINGPIMLENVATILDKKYDNTNYVLKEAAEHNSYLRYTERALEAVENIEEYLEKLKASCIQKSEIYTDRKKNPEKYKNKDYISTYVESYSLKDFTNQLESIMDGLERMVENLESTPTTVATNNGITG